MTYPTSNPKEKTEPASTKPNDQPVWLETHNIHEPKIIIGKVGDFLKLVGMRVRFATLTNEFWEGDVEDLSDTGTHLVLRYVKLLSLGDTPEITQDRKNLAISEIDFAEIVDRRDVPVPTGDGRVWTARESKPEAAPQQPPAQKAPPQNETEPTSSKTKISSKSKGKHDNHERKYLRFIYVHEEAHNVDTKHFEYQFGRLSNDTTSWNRIRKPFYWDVARPETGRERYSKYCEYCGKQLVVEVLSLQLMARRKKIAHTIRNLGLIGFLFSVASLIAGATLDIKVPNVILFIIVFCFFAGIIMIITGVDFAEQPGHSPKGDLNAPYWRKDQPFDGHYIESVESNTESSW